jgi:uncharacterized protein YkwD
MRRTLLACTIVGVLLCGSTGTPANAATQRQAIMLRLINDVRERHGEHALKLNAVLSRMATHHSKRMASDDLLFHTSDMTRKLARWNWSVWGENICYAGTVKRTFDLWMHSAEHRANILKRGFRHIGIGFATGHHWLWTTADFYG